MENKKELDLIEPTLNSNNNNNNIGNNNNNNNNNINNINKNKENSYKNKHLNKEVFSNLFFEFGPKHSRFLKFKEANNLFNEYNNFLSHLKLMSRERNIKNEKICTETEYVFEYLTQITKDDNEKDLMNIINNDKNNRNLFFPTQINISKRNMKTFSNENRTFRNNNNRYYEDNKINNINNNYSNKNNKINITNYDINNNNIKNNYNRKLVILKGRNKLKSLNIENMNKLSIKDLTDFVPDVNKTRRMLLESYEMKEKINRATKPAFHIK